MAVYSPEGGTGPPGPPGPIGPAGPSGTNGAGVPAGGAVPQMLVKKTTTDFDTQWATQPVGLLAGGSANQLLSKATATDFDVRWVNPPAGGTSLQWGPAVLIASGFWANLGPLGGQVATVGTAGNTFTAMPVCMGAGGVLDQLGVSIVTGTAGSVARMGIYNASATAPFGPTTLLYDYGTVNADTTQNNKVATVTGASPPTLVAGQLYWIGIVWQPAAVSAQCIQGLDPRVSYTLAPTPGFKNGITMTGVSAGLPPNFATAGSASPTAPTPMMYGHML